MSSDPVSHETVDSIGAARMRVRRAPKYSVFLVLGGAVGLIAALVLSTVFHGTDQPSRYTDTVYTQGQAFGLIVLWCVPAGIALGGLVALVLDRVVRRHSSEVIVAKERVHTGEEMFIRTDAGEHAGDATGREAPPAAPQDDDGAPRP